MPCSVERCNTPGDLFHEAVRLGLPELRRALDEADRYLPRYVLRELERFTTCGDPSEGFAWLKCERCDHHRLVPFTCQGRGFCPSCGGRRMAATAARLARGRLELRDDGAYVVHFKREWSDGTKAVVLNRTELLERLASIVPPPRKNLITYHGVFGARSSWRSQVVPGKQPGDASPHLHGAKLTKHTGLAPKSPSRWPTWSLLLWRVFGVEGWACPNCGDRMTRRAVVEPPASIAVLPALMAAAARGPPRAAALVS